MPAPFLSILNPSSLLELSVQANEIPPVSAVAKRLVGAEGGHDKVVTACSGEIFPPSLLNATTL